MVLDNVAFWNYADGEPLDGSRTGPPESYKQAANGKLRKIIDKLNPELVILMSKGLWSNLWEGEDKFAANTKAEHRTPCKDQNANVSFLGVNHPTGGFSEERDWHAIGVAIKEIGGRRPERQRIFRANETAPPYCQGDPSDPAARGAWHTVLNAVLNAGDPNATKAIEHLLNYFEAHLPAPEEPRA